MQLVVAGLLVAAGPHATAQTPTERAIVLYREAEVHYNLGEYGLAADKFAAAIRADPSIPGPYRSLGLTYRVMGKCDLAIAYFRKYLAMAPQGKHSTRIRQEIALCAKKLGIDPNIHGPVGEAQLLLRVSEAGAQIFVDSVLRGVSPAAVLPIRPGRHTVGVFRSGFLPWTGDIEVVRGQVVVLEARLQPDPKFVALQRRASTSLPAREAPGRLQVVGLPDGSNVWVDGRPVVLDVDHQTPVSSGDHHVEVNRSGIVPWSTDIKVLPRKVTTVLPIIEITSQTRKLRKWAWATTGAATLLGASGAVLGLLESGAYNDVRGYNRQQGNRADLDAREEHRHTLAVASSVLYGLGAAALGTAIVLFTLSSAAEPSRSPAEAPRGSP